MPATPNSRIPIHRNTHLCGSVRVLLRTIVTLGCKVERSNKVVVETAHGRGHKVHLDFLVGPESQLFDSATQATDSGVTPFLPRVSTANGMHEAKLFGPLEVKPAQLVNDIVWHCLRPQE